jgi:hypothetical protein
MTAIVPVSPEDLGGPSLEVDDGFFEVLARRKGVVLIEFHAVPVGISWFDTFELMFCQFQHNQNTIKVIRKAT